MGFRKNGCVGSRFCLRASLVLMLVLLMTTLAACALLMPSRSQDGFYKKNGTVVDAAFADQGYIHVKHRESRKRLKLRIACGDETYTYDLNSDGEFETFPLQMGSGEYNIRVYEQISGSKYSGVSSLSIDVELSDPLLPFLYPNQYAWYDAQSDAVAQSDALCAGLTSDAEKASAVTAFVSERFVYDYIKAMTIRSAGSYLPEVDEVLASRKGICFDFAALVCCMLRAQEIPTQMVIGYADAAYHAWNRVYIDGQWRLIDTTAAITATNVSSYTAEGVY